MTSIVTISLENDMDLVLAHKRSMKVAEKLGLTTATQTTFATAVSEIARTVIEHTDSGSLHIGLEQHKLRYSLTALVLFDKTIAFTHEDAGFYYAQKLVPEFSLHKNEQQNVIEMKVGLPRSLNLDPAKIALLKKYFEHQGPLNAYEEIKLRNISLHKIAGEQEEEIRQSKRLDEQKTEFIAIASHEIKTPITIIKAYTQIAKKMSEGHSGQMHGILDKIDSQSTKLINLVQQLLDVTKMENGHLQYTLETVNFPDYLNTVLDMLRTILPDNVVYANNCAPVKARLDKLRMEQVLSNILSNAAKYSKKDSAIQVTCRVNEGRICVSIADRGIGMSEESLKSVFNKFYRDKDVIKTHAGLGMGLYIASKIVADHGGEIWAESAPGSGSTFYFTLPVAN